MEKLFGIPIEQLLMGLVIIFCVLMTIMTILAFRNPVLFKIAARNIPRRPVQTVLILVGLLLASLLFSASFSTGDTLSHSIRLAAVENLGQVDLFVRDETREVTGRRRYFSEMQFELIRENLASLPEVDGVAPYVTERVPVVAPSSKLSEPQMSLLGVDSRWMQGFDVLRTRDDEELKIESLGSGDVYISAAAAENLSVEVGDSINIFFGSAPMTADVAGIYEKGSILGGDVSMVAPMSRVQALVGNAGRINMVLVSNTGGIIDGAQYSDEVTDVLEPLLADTGLEVTPVKQNALDEAEEAGNIFSTIFLLFGQFSIAAGILLIFLIFVMLAAERRRELGIARAVGTQQNHVILLFAFEGGIYALIAGALGALIGVGVGWGMIGLMGTAFGESGFELVFLFNPYSVVLAYVLGVVLTFMVVIFSAWKVSHTNIVRAIRDIPEPKYQRRTLRSLLITLALPFLGLVFAYGGIQGKQWGTYLLGVSLILIGLPLIARRFGWLADRAAFTTIGILLLVWWFLPMSFHGAILPSAYEFKQGIELFFLSGVMVVMAGVWLVIYNADLLLNLVVLVLGRIRGLPPILKTAISYPMEHRFRTGMTLAMFSLVIFTLIVMAFILTASAGMFSNPEQLSGGFHIRGDVSYANPIWDINRAIDASGTLKRDDFEHIGSMAGIPIEVRQADTDQEWKDFFVQAVDRGYSESVTYGMATTAAGYELPEDVWNALQSEPGTAVVSPMLVPSRANYNFGMMPGWSLEGFYVEDKPIPETYIEIKEPISGSVARLKVIGILELGAFYGPLISISQDTLVSIVKQPIPPLAFMFDVKAGVDAGSTAKALEAAFLENGFQSVVLEEEIKEGAQTNLMVNNLLQGFMGLGLVVGIAALGVIAARAVVERRHEIGIIRAIGFQKRMVQASFIIESSFVALLGIAIGVALGLGISVQILDVMTEFYPSLEIKVPVTNIVVVVLVAYIASFLTTFIPSVQASRVYPAEALRYE